MDLPNESIMCHRTAFKKRCYDMVTKCKCQLWVHVQGVDPQTEQVISHGACADAWMPKLTIEVAQMVRQNTASTDKVANEVKTHRDESVALGAIGVQRLRDAAKEAVLQSLPSSSASLASPHKLLTAERDGHADHLD